MTRPAVTGLYAEAIRWTKRWFWEADGAPARRYLLDERFIDSGVATAAEVGFLPPNDQLVRRLRSAGVPDVDLLEAGLATSNHLGQLVDRLVGGGYLTLPIRGSDGDVIGLKFRAIPGLASASGLRYTGTRGPMAGAMFGLASVPHGATRVIAVEGEIDQLSVATARTRGTVPPAIALHGKELTEDRRLALVALSKPITLMLDNDDAGRDAIIKTGRTLAASGLHVDVLRLRDGMDANDMLRHGGVPGFALFLAETPPSPLLVAEARYYAEAGVHSYDPLFVACQLQSTMRALGRRATDAHRDEAAAIVDLPVVALSIGVEPPAAHVPLASRRRVQPSTSSASVPSPEPRGDARVAV